MTYDSSYKKAFIIAIFFHVFLAVLLVWESFNPNPAFRPEQKTEAGDLLVKNTQQPEIIQAVSVDNQEVLKTIQHLKEEKALQLKREQKRRDTVARELAAARELRLKEQQQVLKLKKEAETLAIARKKEIEKENQRLKELALQKEKEAKRIEELKKQHQLEEAKIAQVKKMQQEQEAIQRAQKAAQEKAQQQAQLAENMAKQAKIAGEVDKYKALIVNAISRRWILPENVDSSLSSQFRIRLAPDGAVIAVNLMRSSGDPILDRSAQAAIFKASPLPVPSDPASFDLFRDISLTVRPQNVRG